MPLFMHGQFNPVFFGGTQKSGVNTYIGGVSSVVTSKVDVANLLNVNVSRITNFSIVGSDIKFRIRGSYSLSIVGGLATTVRSIITYYQDNDGLINNIESSTFATASNLTRLYFPGIVTQTGINIFQDVANPNILEMPNCTSVPVGWLGNYQTSSGTKIIALPKCASLGTNELNNSVFTANGSQRLKMYVPISKQTSNSGGVEGDVNFVATASLSSIVYVSNYTIPSAISDLSAGTVTSTSIQLNFTAPSSTNTIDFYEVYLNGVYKGKVTASGQTITGLTTATLYKIELLAVDIYYNKSLVSNSINVTTL